VELARALVAAQFPQWAGLPIRPVEAASTDNAMYRLGEALAVRLPRREGAVTPIDKEHAWLARLAPALPCATPAPVAMGAPELGYPYPWGVVTWLDGEPAASGDNPGLARDLARFVAALHAIDPSGGPAPGAHNFWRGAPLAAFDPVMRQRFEWLADVADIAAIVAAWERGLAVAPSGERVWIHGDLKPANLLVRDGRLSGVLDWSAAGVGDPAVDYAAAWTLFDGDTRTVFRAALAIGEAAWARGRAWALVEGVFGLSYYRGRNDALADEGRQVIDRVLSSL